MSVNAPAKQAEIDHLKQKLTYARLEMRRQERVFADAESEVMRLRDRLTELGVDAEAFQKAEDAQEWGDDDDA